jgi:hypothetical protein
MQCNAMQYNVHTQCNARNANTMHVINVRNARTQFNVCTEVRPRFFFFFLQKLQKIDKILLKLWFRTQDPR